MPIGWRTEFQLPLGVPSAELARRLEHEAKVKFSPGAIYGEEDGASFLRVNLACPRATLLEALERGEPIECIAEDYAAL